MQIAIGLRYLFPDAKPLIDYTVMEYDGKTFISEWKLPDPQPTEEEITKAIEAYLTDAEERQQQEIRTKRTLTALVDGCAGRGVSDAFTMLELKSLLFAILQTTGKLQRGTIKPFDKW